MEEVVFEQSLGEQLSTHGDKGREDIPSGGNSLSRVNKSGTDTLPIHWYTKHSVFLGIQRPVFTGQEVFLPCSSWKNHASGPSVLAVGSRTRSLPELTLPGKVRPGGTGIGSSGTRGSAVSPTTTWTSRLYTSPLFLVAPQHPTQWMRGAWST